MKQVAWFASATLIALSGVILLWRFSSEVTLFILSLVVAAALRPLIAKLALRGVNPALAALLWLGHFPPLSVTALGLLTVFAGYTAVYSPGYMAKTSAVYLETNAFDVQDGKSIGLAADMIRAAAVRAGMLAADTDLIVHGMTKNNGLVPGDEPAGQAQRIAVENELGLKVLHP